jgi:hypothetical protein
MSIKVPSNEIVNLLLCLLMQILEFVHGRKLRNIETVGKNTIWLPLQKMLAFVCRDVGDSGENIARVGRSPFNAVSVVDATLSSLRIYIKVL